MKPRRIKTYMSLNVVGDHSTTKMSFEWAIGFDGFRFWGLGFGIDTRMI